MTKKYWNSVINNLNKVAFILAGNKSYYLDGTYKELEDNFKLSVNEEAETLTISFVHPHCIDENEFFNKRNLRYIDIPETRTYHRTEIDRVRFFGIKNPTKYY